MEGITSSANNLGWINTPGPSKFRLKVGLLLATYGGLLLLSLGSLRVQALPTPKRKLHLAFPLLFHLLKCVLFFFQLALKKTYHCWKCFFLLLF